MSISGLERPAESEIEECGHPLVSMAPWRVDEGSEPVEKLTHTEFDAVLYRGKFGGWRKEEGGKEKKENRS